MQACAAVDRSLSTECFVYALCDPETSAVRYVGKTVNPTKRYQRHLQDAQGGYRANWVTHLRRRGLKPRMVILEANPADWRDAEKRWIAAYREVGARLVNLADGGVGNDGWKATPETRARMSAAAKGRKKSPEHVEAVRRALTGRKGISPSEETRAKLSAALKGKPKSEAHAAAIGEAKQGERAAGARLTTEAVLEIRARVAQGETQKSVAMSFGVGPDHVSRIVHRQVWKHLPHKEDLR